MSGVTAAKAPLSAKSPITLSERGGRLRLTATISASIASPSSHSVIARPIATWTGNGRAAWSVTAAPSSAMCQSAPTTMSTLNRNGTAMRLSASTIRSPRKPAISAMAAAAE